MKQKPTPNHCNSCGAPGPVDRRLVEGIEVHVCPDAVGCRRRAEHAGTWGVYVRAGAR